METDGVDVSMKSGLEGQNNRGLSLQGSTAYVTHVSMKSGLEGRNNELSVATGTMKSLESQ